MFWKDVSGFVLRDINYYLENRNLSITQKQGIIICIPNESKSKLLITNWRPITLLNTVYKKLSGSLTNRIKPYVQILINKDQTGVFSGRFIGENTRLLYDIMKLTEVQDIQGMIMMCDFEKAFDSLSWSIIQKNTYIL